MWATRRAAAAGVAGVAGGLLFAALRGEPEGRGAQQHQPRVALAATADQRQERHWRDAKKRDRFASLPAALRPQEQVPPAPYPTWDRDWDNRRAGEKEVLRALGREKEPLETDDEFRDCIRQLYLEPGPARKTPEAVDKLLAGTKPADLPAALMRAALLVRGRQRHIILVRHGQYHQDQKEAEDKKLTEMGRVQAMKAGRRLRDLLAAVRASGRGKEHVRLVSSTMIRARESADIIAAELPAGSFERLDPSPLLVEGSPAAHNIPDPLYDARHVRDSLMETAFRANFSRLSLAKEPLPEGAENEDGTAAHHRDEYEIIVCHANVIRYFVMRALQLPPEAWFRVHPNNCSLTHLRISPDGGVGLFSLGESGYLSPEENTFNMTSRYPFK